MKIQNPYRASGTFTGRSYIERKADIELRNAIKYNDRYPYFLAPRQSGKSSVMERARNLLSTEDLRIVIIDLSVFPESEMADFNRFLLTFVSFIYKKLYVAEKLKSNLYKLKHEPTFLSESMKLLLNTLSGRIVVCIDELDALLESKFKDDFLSQIRALFNERASDPLFERIQFIVAAAVPKDSLISDPNRSPFNVGSQIILSDFNEEQVERLVTIGGLFDSVDIRRASERIHYWTNGSVYLSQNILEKAFRHSYETNESGDICKLIDNIVDEIIMSAPNEIHFINIEKQLREQPRLLLLWEKWIEGKVPNVKIRESLKLAGISDDINPIRNKIYQGVFHWGGTLCLLPKINKSFYYDIFLSYCSKDKNIVHALAKRLKQDGLRVWLDDWVVQPGDSIPLKIQEGLEKSHILLMCMSPAYFGYEWERIEHYTLIFRDPTNKPRRLVPLLIEDCSRPEFIAHLKYLDWRTRSNEVYNQLLLICREKGQNEVNSLRHNGQEILVYGKERSIKQKRANEQEIVYGVHKEIQEWEISSQEEMTKMVEDLTNMLTTKIPSLPENEYVLNMIEAMRNERNLIKQYDILVSVIGQIPNIRVVSDQELDQKLRKFDSVFNEIVKIKDKLSCISFDISKIKMNSAEVVSNLKTMKEELEKLDRIEGLNALSIEKLNSSQTEKLNDLNNTILESLNEVENLIDKLPKNNDTQEFYDRLNELKQSKPDMVLQKLSAITSLIGFAMQLYQQYRPV